MRYLRFLLLGGLMLLAACGDSAIPPYSGPEVTQIYVRKADRKMYLLHGREIVKTYDIALGRAPVGTKQFEGDGKTPEGVYYIDRRNPRSAFHLSLGINYPRPQDVAYAVSQNKKPGGDIFIHGVGRARPPQGMSDWTDGCIAVTDAQMDEIYRVVRDRTPVLIVP